MGEAPYVRRYRSVVFNYGKMIPLEDKQKCGVCHPLKAKGVHNHYGKALEKFVPKNTKQPNKIQDMLIQGEAEKSPGGKTYIDIIQSGEMPAN